MFGRKKLTLPTAFDLEAKAAPHLFEHVHARGLRAWPRLDQPDLPGARHVVPHAAHGDGLAAAVLGHHLQQLVRLHGVRPDLRARAQMRGGRAEACGGSRQLGAVQAGAAVEGCTRAVRRPWCLQLVRSEAGHATWRERQRALTRPRFLWRLPPGKPAAHTPLGAHPLTRYPSSTSPARQACRTQAHHHKPTRRVRRRRLTRGSSGTSRLRSA